MVFAGGFAYIKFSGVGWVGAFSTQHLPRNVLGCEKMQPNLQKINS